MNIEPLTIESEFKVSQFKLYLRQNPENSYRLAIRNYENFLALVQAHKELLKKHKSLQDEYSELIELIVTSSDIDLFSSKFKK